VPVGMLALTTQRVPARKEGIGAESERITFGGVTFASGAFVFADEDGVIVLPTWPSELALAGSDRARGAPACPGS
jgi:regulator of RNase E activity RraA